MSVLMLGIYFLLDLFHTKHQLFLLASGGFLMFIRALKQQISSFVDLNEVLLVFNEWIGTPNVQFLFLAAFLYLFVTSIFTEKMLT